MANVLELLEARSNTSFQPPKKQMNERRRCTSLSIDTLDEPQKRKRSLKLIMGSNAKIVILNLYITFWRFL